jgi:WhiB family redox-sensing transcriptional regulator
MREAWMDDANCVGADPELFYPDKTDDDTQAKMLCLECPVKAICLDTAIKRGEVGVWGGKNDAQRKDIRRKLGVTVVKPYLSISHGTPAGARAHYRAGERPCKDCRDADRAAERERRGTTTGVQRDVRTGRWSA